VGSLLHDIGKILEYEVAGDFRFTLEGKFLGHIVQGHSLVEKWIRQIPDFPERLALDVLHILLSHHGQQEYGSPKTPVTAEALVIHFADDLDAKLDMVRSAGDEPGTEEAFVRGLRRSFLFRNSSTGSGQAEQVKETRDKGQGEEESSQWESGREGEGEEKLETEKRGNPSTNSGQGGETETDRTNEEPPVVKEKKGAQEELF